MSNTLTFEKSSPKLANASKEFALAGDLADPPNGSLLLNGSDPKSPNGSGFDLLVGTGLLDLGGGGREGGSFLLCLGGNEGAGDLVGEVVEGAKGSLPKASPPVVCTEKWGYHYPYYHHKIRSQSSLSSSSSS